jgi:hypothetical protein
MLSVEIRDKFLRIPEILRRFTASPYVTVTRPRYEMLELPVESLRVNDPVNFSFIRVVDDRWLRFSW